MDATQDQLRAAHEAVIQQVTRDGRRWISASAVSGRPILRMMVISYFTGYRHLEELMIALTEAAKNLPMP
jgi:hypothetical protein